MSRRVLIVEPDASGRGLMDRVLSAEGYAAEAVASVRDARARLDAGNLELAIVDELAGTGAALDEVRALREGYPTLPVIVTGTLLTARVLLELLRLGVADALPKPYTPAELRTAVARAFARTSPRHDEALEYAAAVSAARRAVAAGDLDAVAPALARAQAVAPLDAETVALRALSAELRGHDADADRAYRAALALRDDEGAEAVDPYEGLARLRAYGPARPVATLGADWAAAPLWLVTDPARELSAGPPEGAEGRVIVVMALGVVAEAPGTVYYRSGPGRLAFALATGAPRWDAVMSALRTLSTGPVTATAATRARVDVARATATRDAAPRSEA